MMTADEVRDKLRRACEEAGSQWAWCEQHGVRPSNVNALLRGRVAEPYPQILAALGLERVTVYRPREAAE